VTDIVTGVTLWTKHVADRPLHFAVSADADQVAIVSPLSGNDAKDRIKQNPVLARQVKEISSKESGSFVEVLDGKTGARRGEFGVDTGNGSFRILRVVPSGQWVLVTDNRNRVVVLSLEGKILGRMFGTRPAASSSGKIAFSSENETIIIYDLNKMAEIERLSFGERLANYEIVDEGKKIFVLTESQTAYLLDLSTPAVN
jgi:hypothetical protein